MNQNNKIPSGNPFKVPENYFEEINRKILSGTAGGHNASSGKNLSVRIRPYMAVAATVAVLLVSSVAGLMLFRSDRNIQVLSGINMKVTQEILLDEIDLITLEENAASYGLFEEGPGVENKVIIDYLILDNIDINAIYEQL